MVTGGPGTGKTVVAAAIVRGLARLGIAARRARRADRQGREPADPGDRASSSRAVASTATDADRALAASPPTAQTLHRLLGYGGAGSRTTRRARCPVGAVIVDEASMIDLELMDALLDALPADGPARS